MIARKLALGILCTAIAGMTLATSALAAAPETPTGEKATDITATTAKLTGTLNPGGPAEPGSSEPGSYQFSYEPTGSACRGGESQTTPLGSSTGAEKEVVEETVTGLAPATRYTFCLIAYNSIFEEANGVPVSFTTTVASPTIEEGAPTSTSSTSELVRATVNPGGQATTDFVEYTTQAKFDESEWAEAARAPDTDSSLPAASSGQQVSVQLTGLSATTGYRVRFVAENASGTVRGPGTSFTTATAHAISTPDGRAYELVSNTGVFGEPYAPAGTLFGFARHSSQLFQASQDGSAILYIGEPASEGGTGNTGNGEGNHWLAKRSSNGWVSEAITPAGAEAGTTYQGFTGDLATGFLESRPEAPLAPGTPEGCATIYSRDSATRSFQAVITETKTPTNCGKPLVAGTSQDGSKVIFQTEAALTPGSEEAVELPPDRSAHKGTTLENGESCMYGCNLYEEEEGHLKAVNVLGGQPVPNASFGGYKGESPAKIDLSNAISTDGSKIFWTDTQPGRFGAVFVLENGTTQVQVSGAEPAEYWTATPDGRFAYYTETGQLWQFDTKTNTRLALTEPGSEVQGVIGINTTGTEGEYVYLVSTAVLAANTNSHSNTAQAGQPNLYLLRSGVAHFIAALSPEDSGLVAADNITKGNEFGDWVPDPGGRTAEVSPDGGHISFISANRLTGYVNEGPNGSPISEAFVYSATSDALACASCAPTGAPPTVAQGGDRSPLPVASEGALFTRRWMSDNGRRLFFQTLEPLTSADTNEGLDVYEWEADGEGTCSATEESPVNEGCLYLLSGGDSNDYSYLLESDATGDNVFLVHRGPLGQIATATDRNELYDARVGGGFSSVGIGCAGPQCSQSPAITPSQPSSGPPSMSFSGTGNFTSPLPKSAAKPKSKVLTRAQKLARALEACKRDKNKKKRSTCEKSAHKKFGRGK